MWSCGYVVEGRGMVHYEGERDGTLWRGEGWYVVEGRGMVRCGGERDGTLWRGEGWYVVEGRGRRMYMSIPSHQ